MAEHVQSALDQMVAPLRDLLDRNIFTQDEIQAIVARRRESEYLLRRPTARKADFLRYIEAEQMLEKLRKLRSEQRKREEKESKKKNDGDNNEDDSTKDDNTKQEQQHIGDVHIVQHIHLLFIRAIRKFRSDLSLHLLHADFAKSQKSNKRLGKIYAEALQVFPRQTGLWIEAASHEYFSQSRSIRSARVLFQRAVRICPDSEELWLEYFTLELHYAQLLMGRKHILFGGQQQFDENDEDQEKKDDKNDRSGGDYYKIAAIVLKNALLKVSDNIPFRLRVLDTCTRFPNTKQFVDMIQESLEKDYSKTPEAWIARAMHYATNPTAASSTTKMEERAKEENDNEEESSSSSSSDDSDSDDDNEDDDKLTKRKKARTIVDPVVSVLEEAIDTVQTGDMYVQALRFARSYRSGLDEEEDGDDEEDDDEQKQRQMRLQETDRFLKYLSEVPASKFKSADFVLEQSDYLNTCLGQGQEAIRVLKEYCTSSSTKNGTTPASVWIQWSSLVDDDKTKQSILQKALNRVPVNNPNHQPLLLQFFAIQLSMASSSTQTTKNDGDDDNDDDDSSIENTSDDLEASLMDTFQRLLLLAPGKGMYSNTGYNKNNEDSVLDKDLLLLKSTGHACSKYLEHTYNAGGIELARRVYSAVLFQSSSFILPNSGDDEDHDDYLYRQTFIDRCLEIETKTKLLSRIYDKAMTIFEGSPLEGKYRNQKRDIVIYQ